VVAGGAGLGLLEVRRVSTGVLERLRLAVGRADGPDAAALDGLAALLAARRARSMIAAWQPGRSDATRGPQPVARSLPIGVLLGHEALADRGTDHARRAPAATVALHGPPAAPAAWCRLDSADPYRTYAAVLDHFRPRQGAVAHHAGDPHR
jgi:hypothetical protein